MQTNNKFKPLYFTGLTGLLAFSLLSACGDSSPDGGGGGGENLAALTTFSSVSELFSFTDNALGSAALASPATLAVLGGEGEDDKDLPSEVDPRCTFYGEPYGNRETVVDGLDEPHFEEGDNTFGSLWPMNLHYAERTFHCLTTYDSGSPETIRGSFTMVRAVTCALEQATAASGGVNYRDEAADNAHFELVEIDTQSGCFPPHMVDDMPPTFEAWYRAYAHNNDPWTNKLQIMIDEEAFGGDEEGGLGGPDLYFAYDMYVRNTTNDIGFVTFERAAGVTFNGGGDAVTGIVYNEDFMTGLNSVLFDRAAGVVRFESIDRQMEGDEDDMPSVNRRRLLIHGDFNLDQGRFDRIDAVQGVSGFRYFYEDDEDGLVDNLNFTTVNGTTNGGLNYFVVGRVEQVPPLSSLADSEEDMRNVNVVECNVEALSDGSRGSIDDDNNPSKVFSEDSPALDCLAATLHFNVDDIQGFMDLNEGHAPGAPIIPAAYTSQLICFNSVDLTDVVTCEAPDTLADTPEDGETPIDVSEMIETRYPLTINRPLSPSNRLGALCRDARESAGGGVSSAVTRVYDLSMSDVYWPSIADSATQRVGYRPLTSPGNQFWSDYALVGTVELDGTVIATHAFTTPGDTTVEQDTVWVHVPASLTSNSELRIRLTGTHQIVCADSGSGGPGNFASGSVAIGLGLPSFYHYNTVD